MTEGRMKSTTEEAAPVQMYNLQNPEPRAPREDKRSSRPTHYMTSFHIVLEKETRMLGAAQVMVGLIHCALGYFWIQLYIREFDSISIDYLPITLLSGYPFWAFLFFVISGIFAIEAEKTSSPKLLKYTIRVNTHSSVLAIIGLFLIGLEIILFLMKQVKIVWIQRSGMMLSVYLWLFSILELFLAITVIRLGNQAFYHTSNLI
ncbi:membrane-spanning 4-domains subfamily A member 12-like isoform X1 [Canis aureus]